VSGSITVQAMAFDNIGVASVQFRRDGVLVATDTSAPFSFAWDTKTAANGAHVLQATAVDATGNSSLSPAVSVTVSNSTKGNGKGRH
jgi:leucyl aminopeptidase